MNSNDYKYTDFKIDTANLKKELEAEIKNIPSSIKEAEDFNSSYEVVAKDQGERGFSYTLIPTEEHLPYILYKRTNTGESSYRVDFTLGWGKKTLNEEGVLVMPDAVSSKTAFREGGKPAIFSGVFTDEENSIQFKEALFSEEKSFKRYIFDKEGFVKEHVFYMKDPKVTKIYEMNQPLYISYFPNGNPNEVWYSNPKAKSFPETNCTFRHSDDHPVVLSYRENGDLECVDYTGYYFSHKDVQDINNNFPFHSRFRFYKPSFYRFAQKLEGESEQSIMEARYYFYKNEVSEVEALDTVGSWGMDISTPEIIETQLEANPFFEENIRQMLGLSLVSDKQLDNTLMLLKLKM